MTEAPLPWAPRPVQDEAISSWVARIGARYDIRADDLARCILGRRSTTMGRVERLDYCADAELEDALVKTARLNSVRLRTLRIVSNDGRASCWHRQGSVWCPECIRDDITQRGEAHGRSVWRLGCCVICPVHDVLLDDACHQCLAQASCHFRPVGGRLQLTCDICKRQVDPASTRTDTPDRNHIGAFGISLCPELRKLARSLQNDLLAALTGLPLKRTWGPVASAPELIAITCALTVAIIRSIRVAIEPRLDLFGLVSGRVRTLVYEPITLAALTQYAAMGVMVVIATVLDSLGSKRRSPHRWQPGKVILPMDALSFVSWLPEHERRLLHAVTAWEGETFRSIKQ